MRAARRASSRNIWMNSGSRARCGCSRLIATNRWNPPTPDRRARYTVAIPPVASSATSSNLSSRRPSCSMARSRLRTAPLLAGTSCAHYDMAGASEAPGEARLPRAQRRHDAQPYGLRALRMRPLRQERAHERRQHRDAARRRDGDVGPELRPEALLVLRAALAEPDAIALDRVGARIVLR